jgi:hypothetical protein
MQMCKQEEKNRKRHRHFSFFLPQIDLALDRPWGLESFESFGMLDEGASGNLGSLRFSAGVSSMYLAL